jgi:hypothetical protein
MKHEHRIVPGHRGGEYVEGNVIEVEVVECNQQTASHAMWHYAEWRLHGKVEDKIAWKGLAGHLNKEEIIAEMHKEGVRKAVETNRKNKTGVFDPEIRRIGSIAGVESNRRNKTGMFDPSCRIQKLGGVAGLKKQLEENPNTLKERQEKGRQAQIKNNPNALIENLEKGRRKLKELREQGLISTANHMGKEDRQRLGRKSASTLWKDPDHPELGHRTATALHRMQTKRGYPNQPENRVKVKE